MVFLVFRIFVGMASTQSFRRGTRRNLTHNNEIPPFGRNDCMCFTSAIRSALVGITTAQSFRVQRSACTEQREVEKSHVQFRDSSTPLYCGRNDCMCFTSVMRSTSKGVFLHYK